MSRQKNQIAPAIDSSLENASLAKLGDKFRPIQKPKILKSPLRYPGGKSRAVKYIISLIPKDIDILCSPFFGGGSIELACAQRGAVVYGYDAFEPLVNFWKELLKDGTKLARLVRKYHPLTRSKFYSLQQKYLEIDSKLEMAAVFFTLNRASFSGTTLSGGMSPCHPRFTSSAIDRLEKFKANNLSVQKADFKISLPKHKNDFLYLDPPYLIDKKLYGNRGDMHTNFDHKALANIIQQRSRWVLSYNDCEQVRDLYTGYKFLTPGWAYGMNNTRKSNEVIILSHDVRVA